jgi:hypothetical protein
VSNFHDAEGIETRINDWCLILLSSAQDQSTYRRVIMGILLRVLFAGVVFGIGWKLGGYLFDTVSQSQEIQNLPANLKATWTGRSGPDETLPKS